MAIILLIVTGGALGWLASILLNVEDSHGIAGNIASGVFGALMAGLVLCPLIGGSNPLAGQYGPLALLVSCLGAAGALGIFRAASRAGVR